MVSAVASQQEKKEFFGSWPFRLKSYKGRLCGFSLRTEQLSDFLIEIRKTVGLQAKRGCPKK